MTATDEMTFAHWLRERRKELDLTRDKLALCASCSPATIEKIEAGERRPSRQLAEIMARCLGVPAGSTDEFVLFARGGGFTGFEERSRLNAMGDVAHLPSYAAEFIGREREVKEIRRILTSTEARILTLLGPPGMGKTRLSIQAAQGLTHYFSDGVYFVGLANLADPGMALYEVARAVGVRESSGTRKELSDTLSERLRGWKALLVLDNFEHITGAAPEITALLTGAPGVKMLITSRVALHAYGEHLFHVPPMLFPAEADNTGNLEVGRLARFEAVALFVQRAKAVRHDFVLTADNAGTVAGICRKLDGLPLAIELAAFRAGVLLPHEMLERLNHSLDLLTNGPADLPERQRSLRAAVAWSYGLLDHETACLFDTLSVFVGGCDLSAINKIDSELAHASEIETLDKLATLVSSSLVRRDTVGQKLRFSMLQPVREFGAEQLERSGNLEPAGRIHADYYSALAARAEPEILGPKQAEWLERLEREHDNLLAALRYFAEKRDAEALATMSVKLRRFWHYHGHLGEGLGWLKAALRNRSNLAAGSVGNVLQALGTLQWIVGDFTKAQASFEEGLVIYRSLNEPHGLSGMINNLGITLMARGDSMRAQTLFRESLEIVRKLDEPWRTALAFSNLGLAALNMGDLAQAEEYLQESLRLRREADQNDRQGIAQSLNNLGLVARCRGDFKQAWALHTESLDTFRALGDKWSVAIALSNLGHLSLNESDNAIKASELFREALEINRQLGVRPGIADCFEGLACCFSGEIAARLFGASERLRAELGINIVPYNARRYTARRQQCISLLGNEQFEEAWRAGHAMSTERMCIFALAS